MQAEEIAPTIDAQPVPEDGGRRSVPARRVAHFVLLEQLGAGGTGVVFAAFDERLDRRVAIKILRRGGAADTRLLREAQALARLSHPNVVSVYEAGELPDGEVFIAMELVRGMSLRSWQRAPERSWREKLAAYTDAGAGLAAAHRAGIVHRDFKPDNVLVGADSRVRVVDFGLARAAEGAPVLTDSEIAGTPGYMAPEQFSGGTVDARADQFSFCAALYEALYGARPYPDLVFAQGISSENKPAKPTEIHARWLWEAIERGLLLRPEDRHPDMDQLLAILTRDHERKRRLLAAGSIAAFLLLGTGIGANYLATKESPCETSPAELAGVWDEATKTKMKSALLDTQLPYAADLWTAAESRLDQYAETWLSARHQACADTHIHGVQSPEMLDRRNACLTARKRAFAAAVDVFITKPSHAAVEGIDVVDAIGDPDVCGDPGVLRLGLPPPAAALAADGRLEILRKSLARGEALLIAGDYPGTQEVLSEATKVDTALAYAPVHAETLRLRGRLELREGRLAAGEATLRDALELATTERHDELVADLWLMLARDAGPNHHPLEEADAWVRQADAWQKRFGDGDARRRLAIEHARGDIAAARGDARGAAEIFTRALESEAAKNISSVSIIPLLRGRANALANNNEPARALEDYRRALELDLAAWGPQHPNAAATRKAMGVLLIEKLGRIDEGKKEIELAAQIFRAAQGEDSTDVGRCEHALSQADMFLGNYSSALAHAEKADKILHRRLGADHRLRGDTLLAIGVLRYMLRDYPGSMTAYEGAEAILEARLGADHVDLGILSSNIGETLLALGEHRGAVERFERALAILRRGRGPSHPDLALPLKGLGLARLARKEYTPARGALEQALAIDQALEGGDPQELAEIRWALARTLRALGAEPARARSLAVEALEAYRGLGPEWAQRTKEIGSFIAHP